MKRSTTALLTVRSVEWAAAPAAIRPRMVSRTAAVPGGLDGIGDLYIGVFDKNPLTDQSAQPIGNQLLKNANLSSAGA